ncbi:hypothetical protein CDD83_10318 [Cordyceps sp. RAO-2017]|nr:hypothetical protein CDD83_10318 [Cordyceps sp. RAO-2017]
MHDVELPDQVRRSVPIQSSGAELRRRMLGLVLTPMVRSDPAVQASTARPAKRPLAAQLRRRQGARVAAAGRVEDDELGRHTRDSR